MWTATPEVSNAVSLMCIYYPEAFENKKNQKKQPTTENSIC